MWYFSDKEQKFHLAEDGYFKRDEWSPTGSRVLKAISRVQGWQSSSQAKAVALVHFRVSWLLAELAAVALVELLTLCMLEVNHRPAPCFQLNSSLGCEGYSAAGYFGYARQYLPLNGARCFLSQQLPQPLWKGTVSVVPAGSCGWIATVPGKMLYSCWGKYEIPAISEPLL